MDISIYQIFKLMGWENIFALAAFIFTLISGAYFYFTTFFRLVYSVKRVSPYANTVQDYKDPTTLFVSQIIFMNNGRKTLTNQEVKKLEISSEGIILQHTMLTHNHVPEIIQKPNKITIKIPQLDQGDYFVLQILHIGEAQVEGRIIESGKILNTETSLWTKINIVFFVVYMLTMIYSVFKLWSS